MSGYRIAHLVVRSASTSHHKELMVSLFDVQNKLEAINFSPALSHTEASNMPQLSLSLSLIHLVSLGDFFIIIFGGHHRYRFNQVSKESELDIRLYTYHHNCKMIFLFQFMSAASQLNLRNKKNSRELSERKRKA